MKGAATGEGQWIAASNGNRPRNAVPYGDEKDGDPLYVCRASINNGVHPGKLLKSGKCAVGHGGAEKYLDRYEVLVSVVRPPKTAAQRVRDSMFVPAKQPSVRECAVSKDPAAGVLPAPSH